LKEDSTQICNRSQEWLMLFNNDKCKVMPIGLKNTRADYYYYYMQGAKLEDIHDEWDLAIIVQNDLRGAKQYALVVKQANRTLV
jgi:hypothetical protein